MLGGGFKANRLSINLKLAISRLKLLEKKKTELAQKARKEIADYLSSCKDERARIRVEQIIREDYLVEAMEILELYCDLLLARFGLIQSMKELDPGLQEAVSSLIWAAPRLQCEVTELKTVSDQLCAKYSKEYGKLCRSNQIGTVNERLIHKMSVEAPPKILVERYLIEIAKNYNVPYEPDAMVHPEVCPGEEADLIGENNDRKGGGGGGGGGMGNMGPGGMDSFGGMNNLERFGSSGMGRMNGNSLGMDRMSSGMDRLGGSMDRMSGMGMDRMDRLSDLDRLGSGFDRMGSGMDRLGPSLDRMSSSMDRLGPSGFDRLGSSSLDRIGSSLDFGSPMSLDRMNNTGLDRMGGSFDRMGSAGGLDRFSGGLDRLGSGMERMGSGSVGGQFDRPGDMDRGFGGNSFSGTGSAAAGAGGGNPRGCQIFVRNLPFDFTWKMLKDAFNTCGMVQYADIKLENGKSKGCGVVRFDSPESAERACRTMNGYRLNGREIDVRMDRNA